MVSHFHRQKRAGPDNAIRGNHCKHIVCRLASPTVFQKLTTSQMFIFLKVLLVPITSHIWYQKLVFAYLHRLQRKTHYCRALLTSELETVFAQAPEAPNSVTHPRVLDAYLRATGQKAEASTAASSSKKRIPGEEDDCPICYDTMYGVAEATLTFCEECGNALHKECFEQCAWLASPTRIRRIQSHNRPEERSPNW